MGTVILIVVGLALAALLARGGYLVVRGVRDGWIAGDLTGRGETTNRPREPRVQIGRLRLGFASLFIIGLLVAAWQSGMFDKALHNVGLNAKDCATNAFGATFCGDDLDAYERRFSPSYGTEPAAQSYEQCRDEWLDLGSTFAEAQSYCADLR